MLAAGVLLNVLVPDWLQTLLLTVLLLFVINKTVRKGVTQWRQEQKAIRQKRSLAENAVRPRHSAFTGYQIGSAVPELQPSFSRASCCAESSLSASNMYCQTRAHTASCNHSCWHDCRMQSYLLACTSEV